MIQAEIVLECTCVETNNVKEHLFGVGKRMREEVNNVFKEEEEIG